MVQADSTAWEAGPDRGADASRAKPSLLQIPFNQAHATGREFQYIQRAIENRHLSGNGPFTELCTGWLQERTGCARALLTTSCTSAMELAALVMGLGEGDEVIMPSFTFVSTANAVVLRGAVPVFVDIRPDTLNLDETAVAAAVTKRTRAILPVHYAGVGCAMDELGDIAQKHDLLVIEDAAQGLMASFQGRPLGTFGQLGCISFHETKNVTCGEGGALLINEPDFIETAEVMQEKGTNRAQLFRGEVDKYTWIDRGSSFLTSDIAAAFLWAQLESADDITERRQRIWNSYHEGFAELEERGVARRPIIPPECTHNAHMYYLLLTDLNARNRLIDCLRTRGIQAVFHYVPLHSSPAGRRFGQTRDALPITEQASDCLVRLPLWIGMDDEVIERVTTEVKAAL